MPTDKPRITILMAVYEPNLEWLRIQLQSLNAQTYPNLQLYIRDDCSPTVPFEAIQSCVQDCIVAFPWNLQRNEKNLGSNKTFERLTREAEGDLFAYCDQDDEWLADKLAVLQEEMGSRQALLACSDMYIMDANGRVTADSITKVRRHHVFQSGRGLAKGLLMHNFVTGCTMLVEVREAKAAMPFCPYMVHDHYLALWCAEKGSVLSVERPLIRYRVHGGNQTGTMAGVTDKKSYGKVRIELVLNRLRWMCEYFPCCEETKRTIEQGIIWLEARERNWNHLGGARIVWRYRAINPLVSFGELCLKFAPESLFQLAVRLARGNRV